jgi:hypothetical protein
MVPRNHLLLSPHLCHALSSTLLPLIALHKQARNSQQYQGTLFHNATTIVVAHSCSCRCHLCHHMRGQGVGDNAAKAQSSAQPPLSLLTVICTATIDAFAQASKKRPMMSRHRCPPCHCHHCCCTPSFTPLLLLPSGKRARNGRQCQSTIIHTGATFCHCAPLFTLLP